ncbi:MAG: hypothetical protein HC933_08945 [Pleurocapsa sp. SU_196_0]|nr:hypothetical protein [Pleurocapsa sp. SU_196_0]
MVHPTDPLTDQLAILGRWLEIAPLSETFQSQDRIRGFAALHALRQASPTAEAFQRSLELLDRIVDVTMVTRLFSRA